ncbi:MAG: hypothetical protein B6D35_04825 [Candidatus Brocadia sp. UTAMX2]|nr:MAG: hypothetical protein B6D35_04825 [Candidatus Brocadia sp. UTAMX2]
MNERLLRGLFRSNLPAFIKEIWLRLCCARNTIVLQEQVSNRPLHGMVNTASIGIFQKAKLLPKFRPAPVLPAGNRQAKREIHESAQP